MLEYLLAISLKNFLGDSPLLGVFDELMSGEVIGYNLSTNINL